MSLLTSVCALAVGLVLLSAAVGHVRDTRGTRRALAAHGVLPAGLRRPASALLAPVEVLLGAALVLGAVGAGPGPGGTTVVSVAGASAALLLAGFTAYLALVLRRTRGGDQLPCGCGLGTTPLGPWTVVRAGLLLALAVVATLGAVTGAAPGWTAPSADGVPAPAQAFVAVAAGLTLALAAGALPATRAVPAALTTLRPVGGGR